MRLAEARAGVDPAKYLAAGVVEKTISDLDDVTAMDLTVAVK